MPAAAAAFYFDLASPLAYLASERALQTLPGPAPWRPVLARELPGAELFQSFRCEQEREAFAEDLARRARALSLQPLRLPDPFPFDSELAMRVATFAASIGRGVAFAQAAFRQAFAGGHSLEDPDFVVIAAAACEMHPKAVLKAAETRSVRQALAEATAQAARIGVTDVPAVAIEPEADDPAARRVLVGEDALERATGSYLP
jgi:2-hydroxychromene-2-carboxylate isomerase